MLGIVVHPTVEHKASANLSKESYSAAILGTEQKIDVTACQRGKL